MTFHFCKQTTICRYTRCRYTWLYKLSFFALGIFCVYVPNSLSNSLSNKNYDKETQPPLATTAALEDILSLALSDSLRAKVIKSSFHVAKSAQMKAQAPYDVQLQSSLQLQHIIPDTDSGAIAQLAPQRPNVESTQQAQWKNTVSKGFRSGTRIAMDATAGVKDSTFESQEDLKPNFNTGLTFSVTQSLLKNYLGNAWKLSETIAASTAISEDLAMQIELQKLVISVVERFFALTKLQAEYSSTISKRKKNQDILNNARMFFQRGNLEESGLYQIDTRFKLAQELEKQTRLTLKNSWDNIVNELSLDSAYLAMDPATINLTYSSLAERYLKACNTPINWDNITEYQSLKKQYDNHTSQIQLLEENHKPSLDAGVSLSFNNQEDNLADSLADTLTAKHSTLAFTLSYTQSLNNHVIKADLWQKSQQSTLARLKLSSFQSTRESAIRNTCRSIQHLRAKKASLQAIYQNQQTRASLEQERFNIGKLDYFAATEGVIAAIDAKYRLDVLKFDIEQNIWKLSYLSGDLQASDLFVR